MMSSMFNGFRTMIDELEKNVNVFLAKTDTKPNVYSTAASYLVDGERKLTSYCILAKDEKAAESKLKIMIANNSSGQAIEFTHVIANEIKQSLIDKIKSDC